MKFDAIIIGAGHNGLTAAAYLAREGRKVLVLEKRATAGGLGAGEEFHPGYRTQGLLLDTMGVRADVVSDLGLEGHGLKYRDSEPGVFLPQEIGPGLFLHRSLEAMSASNNGAFPAKDREAYKGFLSYLNRIGDLVRYILDHRPPKLDDHGSEGLWTALRTGLKLRGLGRDDMQELLRIAPMCVADWLNETFESELLKAGLAAPALEASVLGPWSAGSTATLLLRECAAGRSVAGGPAAVAKALEKAARAAGAEIRLDAAVKRIVIEKGRAVGVELRDGSEIRAEVVASATDPKTTFLTLIRPADLPLSLEDQAKVLRVRGTTAKVDLALNGPLKFSGRDEVFERARTGETLDDIERACDAIKYRRFSEKPQLEIKVSTVADPSLAPEGHHVVEILAHFAPYALEGGWTDSARKEFGEAVLKQLERYAPGVRGQIAHMRLTTPKDVEENYGLAGGHLHHGEQYLDQLYVMRPNADCAQYSTPIEGLFLCGSGSHPGGGITCRPGALAAEAILEAA